MRHYLLVIAFLVLLIPGLRAATDPVPPPKSDTPEFPAFPGAEGAGSTTPGGRGGRVLHVTNLNDSGPGSFRAACETAGPRIVVFDVAGIIHLKSDIRVTQPFLTVAGQTAPGDGICLRGAPFMTATHDVIVRYIRSRLGDDTGREDDALDVHHGSDNVIFDHCTATWSVDEAFSLSGRNGNITLQYCIIGEALSASKHSKGSHGYGSLARADGPVSFHHNLYIHNEARNPRFGSNYGKPPFPMFDFRNNVIYDYGKIATGLVQGPLRINYISNVIIPGPSSDPGPPIHVAPNSELYFYFEDNTFEGHPDMTANNALFINKPVIDGLVQARVVDRGYDMPYVKTWPASEVLNVVLPVVGASLPVRDQVDARLVNEVTTRTGRISNSQDEHGGWPVLKSAPAPLDSDGDGMPDAWETLHGLNPHDPADANEDPDGDGYTNIEEYLNGTNPREYIDYTKPENNVNTLHRKAR